MMKSFIIEKLGYIGSIFGDRIQTQNERVYHILQKRAANRSADFVEKYIKSTLFFKTREQIRDYSFDLISNEGLLLEFGVYNGGSINYFSKMLDNKNDQRNIYGFDSFQGLNEDWYGLKDRKNVAWSMRGKIPQGLNKRVKLEIGLIEDTLKPFLIKQRNKIAFIHIDTDTYGPAKVILDVCKEYLQDNCIILFDEYLGYPNWENHEHRALNEAFSDIKYSYKGFSDYQAVISIDGI